MFFLGIDGGASKTAALLGDEHRQLGCATDSTCKIQVVGEREAQRVLQHVITTACDAVRIEPRQLARICIGMSGASQPGIPEKLRSFVAELTTAPTIVVGDNIIAFHAAFAGAEEGVLVIAGSGSIAYGRTAEGKEARAGGERGGASDAGSGCWIGQQALHAAQRAAEAALQTQPEAADRPFVQEILHAAQNLSTTRSSAIADLVPIVVRACENGDPDARRILQEAGRELASLAARVIAQLWPAAAPVNVAVAGSVFRFSSVVRESFAEHLRRARASVIIDLEAVNPAEGALAIARHPGAFSLAAH